MRLITFGDSWVFGLGAEYQDGMSEKEYLEIHQLNSKNCFRQLISRQLGLDNVNLSRGGSSNQAQFRLALEAFFGKEKISDQPFVQSDIVLWGITSVYRTELWNAESSKFKTFFYQRRQARTEDITISQKFLQSIIIVKKKN